MAESIPFEIEELAPVEQEPTGLDGSTSCKGMSGTCCVALGASEEVSVDDLEALAATEADS